MLEKLKSFVRDRLPQLLVFTAIYAFFLYYFKPSLLFLDTTISGGDTGSHNYMVYYLKDIFPSIHGWSHDWYAGFPFFYFYPPLLYGFAVVLSYILPINIAFKIVTAIGSFILPLSCFLCLKILDFKKPIPEIAALLSLSFLFLESYNIYGGNIPSTLAGEFSYSFSFSLFWLFIATLTKGVKENKYFILNTAILSLIVLSHPIPVIASLLFVPYLVLNRDFKTRLMYILKLYIITFLLTSFWSLPFLLYLEYTPTMKWQRFIRLSDIFPSSIVPFQILAVFGVFYCFVKKQKNIEPLVFISAVTLIPYFLLDNSKIWNTRFLPFFTLSTIMISALAIGNLLKKLKHSLIIPLFACILILWLNSNIKYTSQWIKWNYEGFEKKETWSEIKPLFDYLKTLPYGRVMWEYTAEYNKFGTPRVLELIPLFSKKPTMEGVLIESALSSPFHFILQAETTKTPTKPLYGIKYPEFDMKKAVKHMKVLGVRYFLAYTDEVKNETDKILPKLATVGRFALYEVPEVALIEPIFDFSIEKKDKNWMFKSIEWFQYGELSKPIIFAKIPVTDVLRKNVKCSILEFKHNYVSFYTDGIGIPHLIKVSYFPKWKAEGAYGPYLVSPSFIAVIPDSNFVRLKFK